MANRTSSRNNYNRSSNRNRRRRRRSRNRRRRMMPVLAGVLFIVLVLAVVLSPLAFRAVGNLFWFFTYRFTISPILIVAPIFALLGILVPLAVYRSVAKSTIVERLREAEA